MSKQSQPRWRVRATLGSLLVLCAVAVFAPSALAANSNFVGSWNPSPGVPWTVTSQAADGSCTGTSADSGFTFTGCHVSGNHYEFTVEEEGYSSHKTN